MKNLNYINCVEIVEYDLIVQSKQEPNRAQLVNLRPSINSDYNSYLNSFNNITSRALSLYNPPDSTNLQGCYLIKTISRDALIKRIIDEQSVEFQELCAYCQYYLRTTIDHYIPQEHYSEFSILPKNMLPCCIRCNGIKNQFWRENNRRLFLHLYNDIFPDARFLFGTLVWNDSNPSIIFRIANENGLIDPNLFQIIETHYNRLGLCELYTGGIAKLISDIKTDIKATKRIFVGDINPVVYQIFLLAKSVDLKQKYGLNYWRAIAIDILANSDQFLNSL